MEIFDCTEGHLAKLLSANPEIYNNAILFFKNLKGTGALNQKVENELEKNMALLDRANDIARDSDYFVFGVFDSWGEEKVENGEGYLVYQKVEDKLIHKTILGSHGPPSLEYTIEFLKRNKIKKVFTLNYFPNIFYNINYLEVDSDNDEIEHKHLEPRALEVLKESNIEVIILNSALK